jgi:uncharacterized protein (DUF1697 family)
MAVYIALLRGVNVGGNIIKMSRLRELCEELGWSQVRTYVQSGNVVFVSTSSATSLTKSLEQKLFGESRLPVSVLIRTTMQLRSVLAGNPFLELDSALKKESKAKPGPVRLYVAFLGKSPTAAGVKKLTALTFSGDRLHLAGKEVYLDYAEGAGKTKLTNALLERILDTRATTRNWNTVNALYDMASQL